MQVMAMSLLPYCLSSTDQASAGSVTPMMNLFAAWGMAFLRRTISMAGSHVPRISLKPLRKSAHVSGLRPNLGSGTLSRLLLHPSRSAEAGVGVPDCILVPGLGQLQLLI